MKRILMFFFALIANLNLFSQESSKEDSCCYVGKQFLLPIYFEVGSNDFNQESKIVLEDLFKFLNENHLIIEIGVHSDERLNETYKSKDTCTTCKRAELIKDYLVRSGIDPTTIIAIGYQGRKPNFMYAKTEKEHQLNRRTVVTILSRNE